MGLWWSSAISLQASDHPIKSVTIFHSDTGTAEITRTFPVSLQSGKNTVNIRGISSCIDTDSVRLRVLSEPAHARVFDVCCNTPQVSARRDGLVAERTLRQQEYDHLVDTVARLHASHGHAPSQTPNVQITIKTTAESPSPKASSAVDELIQTLVQRMRSAAQALRSLDQQILELERELALSPELRKGDGSTVITATVLAEQECEVVLQLTYLVTGARWDPHYDLHVHTSDGRPSPDVSLHQYAKITQSTGEDWNETEIMLSTSSLQTLHGLSAPSLDTLLFSAKRSKPQSTTTGGTRMLSTHMQPLARGHPLVLPPGGGLFHLQAVSNVDPPRPVGAAPQHSKKTPAVPEDAAYVQVSHPDPTAAPLVAAAQAPTRVVPIYEPLHPASFASGHVNAPAPAPLSLVYRVGEEGEAVSLPSDGLAHTVPIATLHLRADHEYVCVPRKSSAVFMQARIKIIGERDMLAGPVRVFLDDKFVAKSALRHIGVNESFECTFGVDTGIKVSSQQQPHADILHTSTDPAQRVYKSVITVTNGHNVDIPRLVIRDAVPLGDEGQKISVALQKPVGLANAKNGEDVDVALDNKTGPTEVKVRWTKIEDGRGGKEDGMYEWICSVCAGAEVALEAEWVVSEHSNG
ncbi:hypothetical protein C8T65DRAFT_665103 [Cerioporus squamosus]|nr:hypothetical protein C8T65DRAFT_665103 [Cerioporus squamosus]